MPVNSRIQQLDYNIEEESLKRDFLVVKKLSKKYEPLVKYILDMYTCERCGWCCKEEKVSSGMTDFETLTKFNKISLKDALDEIKGSIFTLKMPCHYLSKDKCKCYRARPLPCRFYPFIFLYGYFISVSYCPYGKKIINDVIEFSKTKNIIIQNKEESCDEDTIKNINRIDNFHKEMGLTKNCKTKIMNIPYEVLDEFYIWLKKKRKSRKR